MNKVILIGNLCFDNKYQQTPSGVAVLTNTVAVKRNFKNQQGEYDSDFIGIVAYRATADLIAQYFAKGDRIGLEGRWSTRTYTNPDGKTIYVNELMVENIEFLQVKKEAPKQEQANPFNEISDDDLPF